MAKGHFKHPRGYHKRTTHHWFVWLSENIPDEGIPKTDLIDKFHVARLHSYKGNIRTKTKYKALYKSSQRSLDYLLQDAIKAGMRLKIIRGTRREPGEVFYGK